MLPLSLSLCSGNSWDIVRRTICSSYFYNAARVKVQKGLTFAWFWTGCLLRPLVFVFPLSHPAPPPCVPQPFHALTCSSAGHRGVRQHAQRDALLPSPLLGAVQPWVRIRSRRVPRVDLHHKGVHAGTAPASFGLTVFVLNQSVHFTDTANPLVVFCFPCPS